MTIKAFYFDGFNKDCPYSKYFIELNETTYIFNVRWSEYCKCAFLSISDYYDNPIVSGKALVNNLKIRTNKLPYTLYFIQDNNKTFEPTLDNISNSYVLVYNDEEILR